MKFKFFLLILFVSTQSFTQILIDVKTSLVEKKELHIIKVAVIRSLDTSKSYRTTEFGEKYSLWLTNLRRANIGDSIKTDLTIELCGPSFINKGNFLDQSKFRLYIQQAFLTQPKLTRIQRSPIFLLLFCKAQTFQIN